jgi:hypothetical protein
VASVVVGHRRGGLRRALEGLPRGLVLALTLAVGSLALGWVLPPFDTTISGSDSSIYLGTAQHLARHGSIRHRDPLVAEMTVPERAALFRNRFEGDTTGRYARFPGGVPLLSRSGDDVTFSFYHLFPVWLAVGLEAGGSSSPLWMMGFWGVLGLVSLFLIGRSLGGAGLGLLACLLHVSFYPQVFFNRFASSELLAQALFLSGLAALLRGLQEDKSRHLYLAGILWGASCLGRVDTLPLLWLGLTTMAVLSTRMGLRARDWAVPMVSTLLFGVMAVYHQLSNGVYLGRFGDSPLAVASWTLIAQTPGLSGAVLATLVGIGLATSLWGASRARGTRLITALRWSSLIPTAIIGAFFLTRFDGELLARHIKWISLYAAPPVLLVLCAGLLVAAARSFQGGGAPALRVGVALLAGPALCYLVDPLVRPLQPWAMRRFLPMIWPLFAVLSLYGWRELARRLPGPAWAGRAVFGGVALVAAGWLLHPSAGLARHATHPDLGSQVKALARVIPRGALVIIPDSNADLQLQIPLRFVCGRDVLLLPLTGRPDRRTEQVAVGFLARQLERGRRVFLLLSRPADLGGSLARHFRLDHVGEAPLSWERVDFSRDDAFPPPPRSARLRNRVVEVRDPRGPSRAGRITIGREWEDVGVLVGGFHEPQVEARPGRPQVPYRWTGRVATMALPPATAVELVIDTWRPAPAGPAAVEVRVDGVRVGWPPGESGERQVLRLSLPAADDATQKRIVTIASRPFSPRSLGLSSDERELGVRVLSVEIEPR